MAITLWLLSCYGPGMGYQPTIQFYINAKKKLKRLGLFVDMICFLIYTHKRSIRDILAFYAWIANQNASLILFLSYYEIQAFSNFFSQELLRISNGVV